MDIEAILKEYTSMMKQSSLQTMKTFRSEKSSGEIKSPDAKSKRATLAKKKNYSIYMQPTEKKKQDNLVADEEKITGKITF